VIIFKNMIRISMKHQHQIVHRKIHSYGRAEVMFLPLPTHQIHMWCYCLMV
jgi:hypothetical protein